MSRWALNVVGRYHSASGPFAKGGIGLGTVTDIDRSAQDTTPLKSFVTLVTAVGVGGRWSVGGLGLAPRADVLFHLGRSQPP
jgi:hypothetical protein